MNKEELIKIIKKQRDQWSYAYYEMGEDIPSDEPLKFLDDILSKLKEKEVHWNPENPIKDMAECYAKSVKKVKEIDKE